MLFINEQGSPSDFRLSLFKHNVNRETADNEAQAEQGKCVGSFNVLSGSSGRVKSESLPTVLLLQPKPEDCEG